MDHDRVSIEETGDDDEWADDMEDDEIDGPMCVSCGVEFNSSDEPPLECESCGLTLVCGDCLQEHGEKEHGP